jgi:hypothetical protein
MNIHLTKEQMTQIALALSFTCDHMDQFTPADEGEIDLDIIDRLFEKFPLPEQSSSSKGESK